MFLDSPRSFNATELTSVHTRLNSLATVHPPASSSTSMPRLRLVPTAESESRSMAGSSEMQLGSTLSYETRPRIVSGLTNEMASHGCKSAYVGPNVMVDDMEFVQRIHTDLWNIIKYVGHHVLNYDEEALTGLKVFMVAWPVTVLGSWRFRRDVLMTLGICCFFTVLMWSRDIVQHQKAFADLSKYSKSIVTILLTFYVSHCYNRWWAIRYSGIGKVEDAIANVAQYVSTLFPQDIDDDRRIRDQVARWGLLSFALIFKQVHADDNLEDLRIRGLLLPHELECFAEPSSKSQTVWAWMSSYFAHLSYGELSDGGSRLPYAATTFPELQKLCLQGRCAIDDIFTHVDTQLPIPYVHLVGLMVWLDNGLQCWMSAAKMLESWRENTPYRLAGDLALSFFCPFLHLGLLHLGINMANPLRGKHGAEYCYEAMAYSLEAKVRALIWACRYPAYGKAPVWKA